jgi:Immunoglobulin-like domain of bacterial spore germination
MNRLPDDDAAAALRDVLHEQARTVAPSTDSLDVILRRAADHRRNRWLAPLSVAAVVVLLVGGITLAWSRGTAKGTSPSGHATATGSGGPSPSGSATAGPTGSASATPQPGPPITIPVYYAVSFGGRSMLYREYARTPGPDRVRAALTVMLVGHPTDPDYGSLWPNGSGGQPVTALAGLSVDGSLAMVTLSQAPLAAPDIAVQEVVYTVTAANPSVTTVQVSYPGHPGTAIGRATDWTVLAPVWVLTPADGATVTSPVRITGTASVFEAVVNWEVDRSDGTKVASGNTMAPIGAPGRGPFAVTVTLPSGTYMVKAYEISAKDGSITWPDSKTFTVR